MKWALVNAGNDDLLDGLNVYTATLEGCLLDIPKKSNFYQHVLGPPLKFKIYDRYDWDYDWAAESKYAVRGVGVLDLVAGFLHKIGVADPYGVLVDFVGQQGVDSLEKAGLSFSNTEEALIVRRGYGREFDVHGEIDISSPIKLNLAKFSEK